MSEKSTNDKILPGFTLRHTLRGHKEEIHRIAWSPDGRMLAAPSKDGSIWLWDVEAEKFRMLEGHADSVMSVAWSPDGQTLASGSSDNTIRLWDTNTGKPGLKLEGHSDRVNSVAWSPDGRTLASGGDDYTIQLWDAQTGKLRQNLEGHTGHIWSVAWSPDGGVLASGGNDTIIRLWNTESGESYRNLKGHTDSVRTVIWSPDGQTLASSSNDRTIRIWAPETGQQIRVCEGHTAPVACISFSAEGDLLASKSWDGTIRLWWRDTWEQVAVLSEPASDLSFTSLAFHPKMTVLATLGEGDTVIRIWDLNLDTLLGVSSWMQWFNHLPPEASKIQALPRAGQGWPAIRLLRLRLDNIKCFDNLVLDLREANRTPRPCTAIVGDNATGKTALLQAIALGCLGPTFANQIEGIRTRNFLRNGAERGAIELEFELSVEPETTGEKRDVFCVGLGLNYMAEDFRPLSNDEMMFGHFNSADHVDTLRGWIGFQWGFCCGYGAFRGLKEREYRLDPSGKVKPAIDHVLSLFQPCSTLISPVTLEEILQADISSFSKHPAHIPLAVRDNILEMFREIIPGIEIRQDGHQRKLVEKYDGVSTLSELSDGCNSMIGLLGHLVRHALELFDWKKNPFEVQGIVLIDEVDLHLHPSWQRKALFQLQAAFPKLQFIVTTHSPLVLGGVPDGQVCVLKRDEHGRVGIFTDAPSVKGWRVDQLLTGTHFGISSAYDRTTENLMNLYATLLNEHGPEHPDVMEVEKQLDAIMLGGPGISTLDRQAWQLLDEFARNRLDAMAADDRAKMLAKLRRMFRQKGAEGEEG